MKVLVTCPFGLSSVLGTELKRLKLKPYNSFERGTYVDTDWKWIYQINLWSRIANKVFVSLWEWIVKDFDALFNTVAGLDWNSYIDSSSNITVQVVTKNSQLHSMRTIQSVAHKAVISGLHKPTPNPSLVKEGKSPFIRREVDRGLIKKDKTTIYIHIENDVCQVFLNTSWASLHERWWRKHAWEAPLKENVAAGLILLSWWRFKQPLLDPCCGSGTFLIEAAMIARNIAPWLQRSFAFQQFKNFDEQLFQTLHEQAKDKQFEGKYQIIWCDQDFRMKDTVLENAKYVGVDDTITFQQKNFFNLDIISYQQEKLWIVSNPPYGKRLDSPTLSALYEKFAQDLKKDWVFGGIISSYFDFEKELNEKQWSKKRLYNWPDECAFWWKKM